MERFGDTIVEGGERPLLYVDSPERLTLTPWNWIKEWDKFLNVVGISYNIFMGVESRLILVNGLNVVKLLEEFLNWNVKKKPTISLEKRIFTIA